MDCCKVNCDAQTALQGCGIAKNRLDLTSGPGCSKNRQLNELVKRSTRQEFYDFLTKYIDIFLLKK